MTREVALRRRLTELLRPGIEDLAAGRFVEWEPGMAENMLRSIREAAHGGETPTMEPAESASGGSAS